MVSWRCWWHPSSGHLDRFDGKVTPPNGADSDGLLAGSLVRAALSCQWRASGGGHRHWHQLDPSADRCHQSGLAQFQCGGGGEVHYPAGRAGSQQRRSQCRRHRAGLSHLAPLPRSGRQPWGGADRHGRYQRCARGPQWSGVCAGVAGSAWPDGGPGQRSRGGPPDLPGGAFRHDLWGQAPLDFGYRRGVHRVDLGRWRRCPGPD